MRFWFRMIVWLAPLVVALFIYHGDDKPLDAFFLLAFLLVVDLGYLCLVVGTLLERVSNAGRKP